MDAFVVQVFVPAGDVPCGAELRGVVRHVATGAEAPFRSGDEVVALLRAATRTTAAPTSESENKR